MRFKVGDKVFSKLSGKGTVISISEEGWKPVLVVFPGITLRFNILGIFTNIGGNPDFNIRKLTKLERALK